MQGADNAVVEAARAKLQNLPKGGIPFRLLNALLTHAPTEEGVRVIATDIIAASAEPDGYHQLAEFYKTGLLLPMKAGGRTPQVSYHPSRDQEIKTEANAIAVDLETAKRDQAKLKKYTLHRDGYRCVVTRQWDWASIRDRKCQPSPGDLADLTQAAHIIPFSLMSADTNNTLFKKCKIWSVIKSFTNGDNINSLTNVMTLALNVHGWFGMLDIWLEPVQDRPNTYKIRKSSEYILRDASDGTEVTLTSSSPGTLPLPNPHYLAFHAAVAKVVHMAGMAEHLDDILRERESVRVLSDESAAEYLDGLLRIAQKCVVAY